MNFFDARFFFCSSRWSRPRAFAALLALCVLAACSKPAQPWQLTDVSGHMPDLDLSLPDDSGKPVTGHDFDDKHAIGLTGSDRATESVAQRYRVAYQMEKRDPGGAYEVTHSSAVYIFDRDDHARLLATDHDSVDAIAGDLKRVIYSKTPDNGHAAVPIRLERVRQGNRDDASTRAGYRPRHECPTMARN